MEDWEVSASDDEWSAYIPPDVKEGLFIPERLASLFKKIEDEKILTITNGYPRVGPKKEAQQSNPTQANITPPPSQHSEETPPPTETAETPEDNKSFEAFNFDENDGEKPSLKRKTPGSAKRGKKEKVGSMTNVMSDLLRHKYLDDLEAGKKEEPTIENKVM